MSFIRDLIDKDNKICPKALCGVIGFITLCLVAFINRDTVSIGSVLTATIATLGLNSRDINKQTNG